MLRVRGAAAVAEKEDFAAAAQSPFPGSGDGLHLRGTVRQGVDGLEMLVQVGGKMSGEVRHGSSEW